MGNIRHQSKQIGKYHLQFKMLPTVGTNYVETFHACCWLLPGLRATTVAAVLVALKFNLWKSLRLTIAQNPLPALANTHRAVHRPSQAHACSEIQHIFLSSDTLLILIFFFFLLRQGPAGFGWVLQDHLFSWVKRRFLKSLIKYVDLRVINMISPDMYLFF